MSLTLRNARIVTPEGVVAGSVTVAGDQIVGITPGPSTSGGEDLAGGWLIPGFVDIHVHGGGGASYTTGDPGQARAAADFHLRHGTTTTLASLVTSPLDLMHHATVQLAPLVAEGVIAGIHYEGPYLSKVRCGAQNPDHLRVPDIAELSALLATAPGAVRMVTIAPELPGAVAAIEWLVARGVTVAIGHTDATYQQTLAGVTAGASVGTHVFNGMRPPHHREPGPVYALLGSPGVVCELIADGVHLHDGTLRFAAGVTGPDRAALITDAMAAAGMADGQYELGGQPVAVSNGVARLADSGAIAGSTLTMDRALRRTVAAGVSIVDAVTMTATTPSRLLGLRDRGVIAPGNRADLVILDADLRVRMVMRDGQWCWRVDGS
ncbi:MAG TPA: N-acetylglucosamine-6-phosphate deacetylase [Micromonosporaceae bacterium]|jgi:N-acetylglucosamine-6-phosphate deacetylase|nr:N-acetylglucosamine-6-phosphate deacetylase [Micromonosporaceae bacterium]